MALPPGVQLAVWNWPYKFWHRDSKEQWDRWMDEMGWLWAELDVLMPDLYTEFYSGTEASMPAVLASCTAQNASATADYFQSNIDNAIRLRARYNPRAKIVACVWWHYMCAQHVTQDLGYFVQDGNLPALFGASGLDGISLWGSIGDFPGEDSNASEVRTYLDRTWWPFFEAHCHPAGGGSVSLSVRTVYLEYVRELHHFALNCGR